MLVNKDISQEDTMKRAQAETKRKANFMPNNAQLHKFPMVKKTPTKPFAPSPSGSSEASLVQMWLSRTLR
jgi:hypothetical protein